MKTKIHKAISGIKILCNQKIWQQSAFDSHKVTCSKCKKKLKN